MHKTRLIQNTSIHLLIWLLNYLLVAFVVESDWNGFSNSPESTYNSLAYAYTYGLLSNFLLFYIQVFGLVPRVYFSNKKAKYYLLTFSICIAVSLLETYFDFLLFDLFKIEAKDEFLDYFIATLGVNLIYSAAGFYYIFRLEHKKSEREKQILKEESYKAELKFLRAQFNPHFLFNGINNVYHLIGKNDGLAKDTLLQFSELLRYQLYESGTHISLEKELDFVLQYIKMEKTRKGSDIQLSYDLDFENGTQKIVPFLIIPFVENAFKYCSNHTNNYENIVSIKVKEVGGRLSLNCTNTFDEVGRENEVGGIGLTNVKRRLQLAYPNKYELTLRKESPHFTVALTIDL